MNIKKENKTKDLYFASAWVLYILGVFGVMVRQIVVNWPRTTLEKYADPWNWVIGGGCVVVYMLLRWMDQKRRDEQLVKK